jgi:trans-aconitate methyltransferase
MQRWDRQQSSYLPEREQRFSTMLDVLEELLPEQFVAIDLAFGPGSISQRLLSRFPQARCIAVDFDPALLMIGQQVLGDMQGRLRWVEADLREPAWPDQLGEVQVDAVLSTIALHWFPVQLLVQLYHQLSKLVRPGGVVLNGDHLAFAPHLPAFRGVVEGVQKRRSVTLAIDTYAEDWRRGGMRSSVSRAWYRSLPSASAASLTQRIMALIRSWNCMKQHYVTRAFAKLA